MLRETDLIVDRKKFKNKNIFGTHVDHAQYGGNKTDPRCKYCRDACSGDSGRNLLMQLISSLKLTCHQMNLKSPDK